MKKNRLILGVTGIRSDYEIMSSVFKAIKNHPDLELKLVATGAHLSEEYGLTVEDIYKDGFEIDEKIESLINGDTLSSRVKGLGIQLQGLVQTVDRIKPDFLLVLGDREEAITTALVGAYMNIPTAHLCGGDRAIGNVDDQVRHAVTKLAHIHFVTNNESASRVAGMGEQAFRIFNVGNPGLDRLVEIPSLDSNQLSNRLNFLIEDKEPLILLIQHVISSETNEAYKQMRETLEAIQELKIKTILTYPNSDPGDQQIICAIKEFDHLPFLHVAKNIPRLEFVNLMRRASCMLGNSSSGILEAPLLKIPVINIGNRQRGRLHSENVEFVSHNKAEIIMALKKAIYNKTYRDIVSRCSNPYGDGKSSKRIADILSSIPIEEKLIIKDITY